jgi:RNA polymerase sigma-70 factor, ECF subfamily
MSPVLSPTHLHAAPPSAAHPHQRSAEVVVSFRDVYDENVHFVWRNLRRMGVRSPDVEDVCQEVFVIVHRRLSELDMSTSPRGWLFAVCMRTARDYRRRAHIRREHVTDDVPERSDPATQPAAIERREARALLDDILGELDDDKRAVFVLYELEQIAMSEICATLGCPIQTAYSRLHAARAHVEAAVKRLRLKGTGA